MSQDSLVLIKFIEENAELLLPLFQEFGVTTTNELASWEWRKRACIHLVQFLHNVLLEGSEDRISVTDQECHLLVRHIHIIMKGMVVTLIRYSLCSPSPSLDYEISRNSTLKA